jgi:hypothetical protein
MREREREREKERWTNRLKGRKRRDFSSLKLQGDRKTKR